MTEESAPISDHLQAVEMLADANLQAMQEVRGLRQDIASVDAKRGRDLNLFKWAMALVVVLTLGVGLVAISNRPILDLIRSTVTPNGTIYKQNQEQTAAVLQSLVAESDCRVRRARMDLPPPPTTILIKGGQAVSVAKAPCGDLADSPPGFQSPPRSEPAPAQGDAGFDPVPYALAVAAGAVIAGGAAIARNRRRSLSTAPIDPYQTGVP